MSLFAFFMQFRDLLMFLGPRQYVVTLERINKAEGENATLFSNPVYFVSEGGLVLELFRAASHS